jgi:KaiC/GvpD/RAD55 family RecA-like ATPase
MWLSIIVGILKVISDVSKYLSDRQLLESGKALSLVDGLSKTLENMEKANEAKNSVIDSSSEYAHSLHDKFERKDE